MTDTPTMHPAQGPTAIEQSKADFIAIAAHELKTPLTLIEGYVAMLKDQLNRSSFDSLPVILAGVDQGTRRLREIIDDLIDMSLIDSGMMILNFQPVWLNRLLEAICRDMEQVSYDRRLDVQVVHFPGIDELMFADGGRLFQAFRNLISNAVKFTPNGGWIRISGCRRPGFIELVVADSGIGIAVEDQERIFEKFGCLGNSANHSSGKTKFKGGGPGLGLPITRGIVRAHGGEIWVVSEGLDEVKFPGTEFHILLPFRKEPPDQEMATLFEPLLKSEVQGRQRINFETGKYAKEST